MTWPRFHSFAVLRAAIYIGLGVPLPSWAAGMGLCDNEPCSEDTIVLRAAAPADQPPAAMGEAADLVITSDPPGSVVFVDGQQRGFTPCRLRVKHGIHELKLWHRDKEELTKKTQVASGEETHVHVVLGESKPWKLILPAYVVGSIFTGAGIFSVVYNSDAGPEDVGSEDLMADERRFRRNLGITSIVLGVPMLVLATYLAAKGRRGEIRTFVSPSKIGASLLPAAGSDEASIQLQMTMKW